MARISDLDGLHYSLTRRSSKCNLKQRFGFRTEASEFLPPALSKRTMQLVKALFFGCPRQGNGGSDGHWRNLQGQSGLYVESQVGFVAGDSVN